MYFRHDMYDYVRRTNGWTLTRQFLPMLCTLTKYTCAPIFIQIADDLDLHFQGHIRIDTLASLCVIITQTVTDRANIAVDNTYEVVCGPTYHCHIYMTLNHSKGQGQRHAHFDCEYLANGDR